MGLPEPEHKDEGADSTSTPPKIEILSELDAYQQRIENQWESAKNLYQDKINKILDEFIQQNLHNPTEPIPKTQTPPPPSPPPRTGESEVQLEHLLKKAEQVINLANKKSRVIPPRVNTQPFQLAWNPPQTFWGRVKSHWKTVVIVSGIAVAVAGFGFLSSTKTKYISLPYGHATGLIIEQQNVYVIDWFRRTLYTHKNSRTFPILSVDNMPNQFVTGFAKSDDVMWSIEGLSGDILEHSLTSDHFVRTKAKAPGKKPVGLYFDGTDLWSMDDESKKLFRHHSKDVEDIKATYSLPLMNVSAMVVVKNRLWILSEKSRILKEFRLEDPVRELQSIDLDPFLDGRHVTSFAFHGRHIYFLTENPTNLVRVPLSALKS